MTKSELKAKIHDAFSGQPYPEGNDFFKAIAHRDYLEYGPTGRRKEWQGLSVSELLKYYDFLFFLEGSGAVYYVPAYMCHVLDSLEAAEGWPSETLFMTLRRTRKECFSEIQRGVVLLFLDFCTSLIKQGVSMDESLLEEALVAVGGSGTGDSS